MSTLKTHTHTGFSGRRKGDEENLPREGVSVCVVLGPGGYRVGIGHMPKRVGWDPLQKSEFTESILIVSKGGSLSRKF